MQGIKLDTNIKHKLLLYLKSKNFNKILILVGNKSKNIKVIKNYLHIIKKKFQTDIYIKKSSNPDYEEAFAVSREIKCNNIEAIIAIGGGGIIDTAKLISAFQPYSKIETKDLILGKKIILKKLLPVIAVPTTAGTGSEVTHFAVVYYKNIKYSLASKKLIPKAYFLDAKFIYTMPLYLSASTGFDALSQAIESAWSISSTPKSRKYSYEAINIINKHFINSLDNNKKFSKNQMMIASHLSGKAINITKTTAPHALSYKLASIAGISHGHSVAITLGHFFEINYNSKKLSTGMTNTKLNRIMNEIFKNFGVNNAISARKKWFHLMKKCKLKSNIKKIKIKKNRELIISSVNIERLRNHPIIISKSEFNKLF